MQHTEKLMLIPMERYNAMISQHKQSPSAPSPTPSPPLDLDVILAAIPKHFRMRVKALISHIMADPEQRLRWDEKGQLIFRGQTMTGSHITDLLKDSQRKYTAFTPIGREEFHKALIELNVPKTLMVQQHHTHAVKPASIPPPPGIRETKNKNKKTMKTPKWIDL